MLWCDVAIISTGHVAINVYISTNRLLVSQSSSYTLLHILRSDAPWEYVCMLCLNQTVTSSPWGPTVLVSCSWHYETLSQEWLTGSLLGSLSARQNEKPLDKGMTGSWKHICGPTLGCVCVWERDSQVFENVVSHVLCVWMCGCGEGIWWVFIPVEELCLPQFLLYLIMKLYPIKTQQLRHFILKIYIDIPHIPHCPPHTGSGSRPRSGRFCFLHFLPQTWLFRFFFFSLYKLFYLLSMQRFVRGQHFLLLRAVWCQHCLLQTQLFFPTTYYSAFSLKTPWTAEVTRSVSVFVCDNRNNSAATCGTHCVEEDVPAKWLSGATYYCSHHLLHPTGPPSWWPAPTSLLLLHLSKGTKTERAIWVRDMIQTGNTKRELKGIFGGRKEVRSRSKFSSLLLGLAGRRSDYISISSALRLYSERVACLEYDE